MNAFVINPENQNNGSISIPFWPIIELADFTATMRIGGTNIPEQRLRPALISAILITEHELKSKISEWQIAGHENLLSVPSPQLESETKLVFHWRRAVYHFTASELIATHPDITISKDGYDQAEAIMPTANELLRIARGEIAMICDVPKWTCFAE